MEKYCDKCNIIIEGSKKHCPLCGRYCDKDENFSSEKNDSYPDYVAYLNKRAIILKIILASIFATNIVLILTELIFTKKFNWSLQFLIASIFFVSITFYPFNKNFSIIRQNVIFGLMFTAYIITLELTTNTFGWGLVYVIPLYYLFMEISCLLFMFYKRYNKLELILPVILIFLTSLGVFLANLFLDLTLWPSFVALIGAINLLALLLIFKFRKTKNELKKNLHI